MKNLCKHFSGGGNFKHPASKSAKGIFLSLLLGSCLGLSSCSEEEIDSVERTKLDLSFEIEGVKSRGRLTNNIPIGSKVGVKLDGGASTDYDIYKDLYYTCSGTEDNRTWTPSQDVGTSSNKATLYAYWPYTSGVNISAIPVDMTAEDQTDWLYATPVEGICSNNAKIQATLNHALANISVSFDKGTYLGTGNITKIAVRGEGIASKGTFNAAQATPDFTRYTDKGAAFERTVSTTPGGAAQEIMVIPTGVESPFTFTITLDGTEFTATTAPINLQKGYSYHYTLKLGSTSMEISTFKFTEWQTEIKESIQVDELDRFADWVSAVYLIDDASVGSEVELFGSSFDISSILRMIVDGVEVSPSKTYTFEVGDRHYVKILLANTTILYSSLFNAKHNIVDVKLPTSLKQIQASAFAGCKGLTEVTIPESVNSIGGSAFANCTELKEITIPNSVTSIGDNAFYGCTGLESLSMGTSVKTIGDYAFYLCTGLKGELRLSPSLTSVGYESFYGCYGLTGELVIPEGVGSLDYGAFQNCSGFTSLKLPKSLKSISGRYVPYTNGYSSNNGPFVGCTGLTSIIFPETMTYIGHFVFTGCTGLTEITIPNSVTSLGAYAFEGCTGLKKIDIGNGVETLGDYAFGSCSAVEELYIGSKLMDIAGLCPSTSLKKIIVHKDNNMLDSRNDCNAIMSSNLNTLLKGCCNTVIPDDCIGLGGGAFSGCIGLTEITIPNSVTRIGDNAFTGCTELTEITIPNSVTNIGGSAFSRCTGLTEITIPNSVTSIGGSAFNECTGLTEITIPNSVTNIGTYAFKACKGLISVKIPTSITSIAKYMFQNCSNLTSVDLGEGVQTIDEYAFYGCSGLKEIILPATITKVSNYSFQGCSALEKITLLALDVPTISNNAFYGISSYGVLVIPESSEELYKSSNWLSTSSYYLGYFKWRYRLNNIAVDGVYYSADGKTALLADTDFSGQYLIKDGTEKINNYAFYNCSGLTEVTIPNSVQTIGAYAFSGCANLNSIDFGASVTSIGANAFENCGEILGTVDIPNSVTSIGNNAFYNCKKIITLNIGTGLSNIGNYAFQNCANLQIINSKRTTAPSISSSTFQGVKTGGTLTVPAGCKSAYSTWMKTSTSYYYLGRYSWSCVEAPAE